MIKYNMIPRSIVATFKDKNPENLTSVIQVYKARATYNTIVEYVSFGVDFYCTYKTNRYRLPLLKIVCFTSMKLMFSIGFAYLEHERDENFTWALEKLKEFFSSENLLPKVVVTDRELVLMNVMENNIKHLNREIEFVKHLKHFEVVCADIPLFVKYMSEAWLTPYKEWFVDAWTNIVTHLIKTTTNRVEYARCRLKNILTTSREDLCRSWDVVNTMLKLQLGSIKVSF
ncbi:unnamed protein product [Vicia faba]|uniref:MULE transposase domain-containing protein n=1 Tax=Vicia faba TaxID=3906 RepID=A0AAV1AUY7_VICFA|nr:unnamed protein product [Vicia faba]